MMMGGQSSQQLQQHARNAFDASEKLLRQAESAGGANGRFYRAANRYATTLRTLGGASSGRGSAGGGAAAGAAGASGTNGDSMGGVDLTSVTLINHGVKEALDSLQLKQMVRMMGAETDAGRALMEHAQQMDSESRQAIESLAMGDGSDRPDATGSGRQGGNRSDAGAARPGATGAGRAGAGAGLSDGTTTNPGGAGAAGDRADAAGGRGGVMSLLVQQSREVLQAIRELDGDAGQGGGERSGRGAGRDASGTGNQGDRSR